MKPWNRPNDLPKFLLKLRHVILDVDTKDHQVLANRILKRDMNLFRSSTLN